MIHIIALYGSAALVGLLFAGILTGLGDLSKKTALPRTDYELCQEVQEEVNLQVGTLLTQEEANQISDRCFSDFADQ